MAYISEGRNTDDHSEKWTFMIVEITGNTKGKNILSKVVSDNLVINILWCLMVSLICWLFERRRNDLIHTVCTFCCHMIHQGVVYLCCTINWSESWKNTHWTTRYYQCILTMREFSSFVPIARVWFTSNRVFLGWLECIAMFSTGVEGVDQRPNRGIDLYHGPHGHHNASSRHPSNDSAGYKISSSSTQQQLESLWQSHLVVKLIISPWPCQSSRFCLGLPQRFLATSRVTNLSKCNSLSKIFEILSLSCLSAWKSLTPYPIIPPISN